jgi:hypothetical protein
MVALLPSREDWDYQGTWDDDIEMFVAEIRGSISRNDEVIDALDLAFRRFGSVENVLYYRANNTSAQRTLVETLNMSWTPAKLPMLIVLDKPPANVESGDSGLQFEFGDATSGDPVIEVVNTLMIASEDEDFMSKLTWEKRKNWLLDVSPQVKEISSLAVSVVGLGV